MVLCVLDMAIIIVIVSIVIIITNACNQLSPGLSVLGKFVRTTSTEFLDLEQRSSCAQLSAMNP